MCGSSESISGDAQFSDVDVPVSNDLGDFCENSGNGLKTGMPIDMRVRWNDDSSLLAGLYMLLGILCTWNVALEGTLFRYEFYTQRMDSGLCDQLVDLMIYFDLLWDEGEKVILSVDDFPGVFPQEWLPPRLYFWVHWRLPEFALMQLSGVCFMQVNRCFSI